MRSSGNLVDGCVADPEWLLCKVNGVLGTQSGRVQPPRPPKMTLIKDFYQRLPLRRPPHRPQLGHRKRECTCVWIKVPTCNSAKKTLPGLQSQLSAFVSAYHEPRAFRYGVNFEILNAKQSQSAPSGPQTSRIFPECLKFHSFFFTQKYLFGGGSERPTVAWMQLSHPSGLNCHNTTNTPSLCQNFNRRNVVRKKPADFQLSEHPPSFRLCFLITLPLTVGGEI